MTDFVFDICISFGDDDVTVMENSVTVEENSDTTEYSDTRYKKNGVKVNNNGVRLKHITVSFVKDDGLVKVIALSSGTFHAIFLGVPIHVLHYETQHFLTDYFHNFQPFNPKKKKKENKDTLKLK